VSYLIDPRKQEASALIKAGDTEAARDLISQILRDDSRDADGWYLAAYLVNDRAKKIEALERALQFDPSHEMALKALNTYRDNDPLTIR